MSFGLAAINNSPSMATLSDLLLGGGASTDVDLDALFARTKTKPALSTASMVGADDSK